MPPIYVNGEWYFISDAHDFASFLDKTLGSDAAKLFKILISSLETNEQECTGECDKMMKQADHYIDVIQDAVAQLKELKVRKSERPKLNMVIHDLENEW